MLGLGIKKKFKNVLKEAVLLLGWFAWRARVLFRRLPPGLKEVVAVLDYDLLYRKDDDSGRYAYWILKLFSDAGNIVYFIKGGDFKTYRRLERYGRQIYSIKNVKFVSQAPARTERMTLVFDDEEDKRNLLKSSWKKIFYVNTLKAPSVKMGEITWIPYPMHPTCYAQALDMNIPLYRSYAKTLRVFFGGNTAREYYDNPILHVYGQMTRLESFNFLLQSKLDVRIIESSGKLNELIKSVAPAPECILFKADHPSRISPSRWMEIISSCDFFICLSGTNMPMCHNAIESLAVGTVPIVSCADWFFPPLEHGKNALVYSDKESLAARIQEAFKMSEEDRRRLRMNAMTYYDQNLSPESFQKKVESGAEKVSTLMLYPRLEPTPEQTLNAKHRAEALGRLLRSAAMC